MVAVLHGDVSYPGVLAVEGLSGTISHGVSPATFVLRMHPQEEFPDVTGALTFTDGNETVVLPGCKLANVKGTQDGDGSVWTLEIQDRRWRWRDLGLIDGRYNQYDPFGKLYPWTIRSPTELATLCLLAMGEVNFTLRLPPGLNYPGPLMTTPIRNISGVNPEINWDAVPPAAALQQVAESCGCRVIYQVSTDSVLVCPVGEGADLPDGSIARQGPSVKVPALPDCIAVRGAPTKFQVRLALEPVGEEWNGHYRPIDLLSYAPNSGVARVQIAVAGVVYAPAAIATQEYDITVNGATVRITAGAAATPAGIAAGLAAAINNSADPRIQGVAAASSAGAIVAITGVVAGRAFPVGGQAVPPLATAGNALTPLPALGQLAGRGIGWNWSVPGPGGHGDVVATGRLTLGQARALARKSIWRLYRVADYDASGLASVLVDDGSLEGGWASVPRTPINVPGYGLLASRFQLVLTDTQVDQIQPELLNPNLIVNAPGPGQGQAEQVDFYNGYSRDVPARVYGSVAFTCYNGSRLVWRNQPTNTDSKLFVPIGFTVDAKHFLVRFDRTVYFSVGGEYLPAALVLQTGVFIRDRFTNQLVCFTPAVALPGRNGLQNPLVEHHPDVQLNITSTYSDNPGNRITSVGILEADPLLRAGYYLDGMTKRLLLKGAQTLEYNGIRSIDLDGAIAQVSWSIGGGGCSTTASRNAEHSTWVAPYAARRRAEFLPPPAEPAEPRAGDLLAGRDFF